MERCNLGLRIGKLRDEKGWSQDELSKQLETVSGEQISREKIKNWENNERQIKASDIIILSKCFGVSSDYFLGLTEHRLIEGNCREAAEYTGLSESAVEALHNMKPFVESYWKTDILSELLCTPQFEVLINTFLEIKQQSETVKRMTQHIEGVDLVKLSDAVHSLGYEVYSATEILQEIIDEFYGTRELLRTARIIEGAW